MAYPTMIFRVDNHTLTRIEKLLAENPGLTKATIGQLALSIALPQLEEAYAPNPARQALAQNLKNGTSAHPSIPQSRARRPQRQAPKS
jgi:hypothetical protein